ncbi:hypothetical protein FG379_001466 [Cryptosporidium bovis]|uniref:uncharacterized protein n=1 Tax=Cryptosporidium bovis TaxID=310047 RepID=UPI003519F55C|nr:hypothetical protein FG379_001466 [Cryptosporidium bovis]
MNFLKHFLLFFVACRFYLSSSQDISNDIIHVEESRERNRSEDSLNNNNTEILDDTGNDDKFTWSNVLKGMGNAIGAIGDFFVRMWNLLLGYIGKDSKESSVESITNGTELNEDINRTLWKVDGIMEAITELNVKKAMDILINQTNSERKTMLNETKRTIDVTEDSKIDLLIINQSTSEEEMLSGVLLSCCYFALFIICWLFAYIKDKSDWVSILRRPNVIFLQQIGSINNNEDDKITLFCGVLIPYTNIYLFPRIELNIGKIRILTIIIQVTFFPLTIIHFFTSKFNVSHFHFEYFYIRIKDYYDLIKEKDFILKYYYKNIKEQDIRIEKEYEVVRKNYSEKDFEKCIYNENIYILNLLRYLSNKDNSENLPTNEDINNWCDGFWLRVNKLTIDNYKELLPRLSCIIILKKFVNKERLSHDFLRRLSMQIIGANLQSDYVRDWVKKTLVKNNPKLDIPFNWIPRRPTGSIKITLQENGIVDLIRGYKKRMGIFSENQIKLLYDITSGNTTNLDCYLWFTDELQTICIHPVLLCDCIKGYDSLEWLGPMGYIPFEKLSSGPVNDLATGIVTLTLNDNDNPSLPVTSGSGIMYNNIKENDNINSTFPSSKINLSKTGIVNTGFKNSGITQIKFTIIDNNVEDISSFNYIINGLLPKSKLRLSSNSSSTPSSMISSSSTTATKSKCESLEFDTMINTLPNSVLNEGTNDVFWGDKLSLRSKNMNTGDYELELSGTCHWDFDMPIPYTANSVLVNGVLTYIWINYDSRLLCIQRKDESIEEMGDHNMIKRSRDRKKEVEQLKEAISISHLKSFDDITVESFNTTPGSDSYIEILNLGSILSEPNNDMFSVGNENIDINTVTRGKMSTNNKENRVFSNENIGDKWLPFDKSLSSVLGVLTNNNVPSLHPVYAVPGVLCGVYCTRGYFIGSIISIHIFHDSKEDIIEEYIDGIESQLLITFEGGLTLRINTFSQGTANSIKETLESIISSLEDTVMLPMRHSISKLNIPVTDNNADIKNGDPNNNSRALPNNLANALFSLGVSPPDLVARCDQIVEYESLNFKDTFIKSFTRFNPITGRLQWNSSSPRIYRWLSYTTSTSISHFLIFYLLSTISKVNKIENGILVGWISYCILNISKMILDSAMNFNTVLQILSIKQQAAYTYLRLWTIWLTSSFCFFMTILLSVLTVIQSTKPGNNIGTSSGFILNDINYSISTWIAGFTLTFLSLIIQPLFLSLSYSILILSSRVTSKFDGIVAFFKYFNSVIVLKNGIMPVRPYCAIKIV